MRSLFGCDSSKRSHRFRVEYIDGARVAYCDIEAFVHAIEKHDIRRAAQGVPSQDLPGPRIERDQFPRVAGAEQAMRVGIEIEPASIATTASVCEPGLAGSPTLATRICLRT